MMLAQALEMRRKLRRERDYWEAIIDRMGALYFIRLDYWRARSVLKDINKSMCKISIILSI
jgi:hypothetical protein